MDGDPVTGEPSETSEVPRTLTELFMKVFPEYIVMGMTYEEFWRGPSILARAYRKAYEIQRKNEEWERWRQGAYFYDALLRVAPVMRAAVGKGKVEPGKYPNEPWPLTEKEAREREERDRIAAYNRMKAKLFAEAKKDRERLAQAEEKGAREDGGD